MSDSLPPVVVTRPLVQALPLADKVSRLGRAAVVFPLLDILPLDDLAPLHERMARLEDYAMVAFVSPNAIDAALPLVQRWPSAVAIGVVGAGSRSALARHGITDANARIYSPEDPRRSDSEALVEILDRDALRGQRVLIVRGESGREFLADALRAAGVQVDPVAAYRRTAPALDAQRRAQLVRLLDDGAEWLITSSEAMRILHDFVLEVRGDAGLASLRRQRLIVPHKRIAETAQSFGCEDLIVTASGDDQLLAALQSRP